MRILTIGLLIALTGCQRERTNLRPSPSSVVVFANAATESDLHPGGAPSRAIASYPAQGNAYAISEGQRLFNWYNCSGCHANGGGGIGPPLIKQDWIYGGQPENIFDTIVKGRPNGMPAWGGKIPEYQIWQIVAFVRSLSGMEQKSATPARSDTIQPNPQTAGTGQ